MYRLVPGTREQIDNIHWTIEKARESQKTFPSASLTMLKSFTVWTTTNWKILKEMGVPDHLTCLLKSLYVGQKVTVRIICRTTGKFKTGKEA